MPVVCCAKSCLPHKLGPVGRLNADIFILRLVNLFMGIANGCICAGFHRAHGKGAFDMGPLGFHLLFKFQVFFRFPGFRVGSGLNPQFTAGGQTRFGLF